MNVTTDFLLGWLMPFLGTTLGAALVFFLRGRLDDRLQKVMLGFSSGVMMAASVWSLLIPAIDMAQAQGKPAWIPCLAGFLAGVGVLLVLERLVAVAENAPAESTGMLVLAITLHNIPEGMAVGVALAGMAAGIPTAGALALSFGIAVQNIPEGAVVSLPLAASGTPRIKAFLRGFQSGAVEPIAAIFTVILVSFVTPVLPYILAFAAGAMIYVVVEELIPQAQEGQTTHAATIGAALGFAVMMTLDIALG